MNKLLPWRILIVDDDVGVCRALDTYLRLKGFETHCALNGPEAVRAAKSLKTHIMLLDLSMPGMNGFEVIEAVRSFDKKIAVIMITANNDRAMVQQAMDMGVAEYLIKPVGLKEIETSIKTNLVQISA